MRFRFIARHRGVWGVRLMCSTLGVSRSGYYAWLNRPPSSHDREDEILGREIRRSHLDSGRTYGARRIWQELLEEGYSCGLHRVERLMREQALRSRPRRRQPRDHGRRSILAPNILARDFAATGPNQKWVSDFTYIPTAEGWLYVAAVMDLFSRRIVGWSMQSRMTSTLVSDALMMAVWRRGRPAGLMHHSDQGSQYSSIGFQSLLRHLGITCSMSRAGEVWDNSAMESFFSTLKTEKIRGKFYRTRRQAKQEVFEYIECFYNPKRRHSTLGYISPIEYENRRMCA